VAVYFGVALLAAGAVVLATKGLGMDRRTQQIVAFAVVVGAFILLILTRRSQVQILPPLLREPPAS